MMLVWVFTDELLWLPATGPRPVPSTGPLDWPLHMVLPVLTLTLATVASWSTQFRATIEDALRSDYVRTARAKGLKERLVVRRHALRPAALPVITVVGMSLPTMFNNVVAVEMVFVMYGLGSALIGRRQPPVRRFRVHRPDHHRHHRCRQHARGHPLRLRRSAHPVHGVNVARHSVGCARGRRTGRPAHQPGSTSGRPLPGCRSTLSGVRNTEVSVSGVRTSSASPTDARRPSARSATLSA